MTIKAVKLTAGFVYRFAYRFASFNSLILNAPLKAKAALRAATSVLFRSLRYWALSSEEYPWDNH